MQVVVFVTVESEDDPADNGTGPLLFIADSAASSLPDHPRGMYWRYFATVPIEDRIFGSERPLIEAAFAAGKPYVSPRLLA